MRKILSIYVVAMLLGGITGFICSLLILAIHGINQYLALGIQFFLAHDWPAAWMSAIIGGLMAYLAWWITSRFAPEAAGSGIPEIEAVLLHKRELRRWAFVIPVKFIGAVLAISAKMVLGREGPSVQIGGHLGAMLSDFFKFQSVRRDSLIAAGAAAGLAAAFNAPIAGVLFFLEELRKHFNFSFTHFKVVALACVMSTVILQVILGNQPAIEMPIYSSPNLTSLIAFFLFGVVVGFAGVVFNFSLMKTVVFTEQLSLQKRRLYVVLVGLFIGYLAYRSPLWVGGGYGIIGQSVHMASSIYMIGFVLIIRFILTMLCYGTGVPGGIFAPILALGTMLGVITDMWLPAWTNVGTQAGMFAVAGMGGLFSATVRAPITGVLLVVEMTQNYSLILPLMITCLTATTVMQCVGSAPIYTQLMRRING